MKWKEVSQIIKSDVPALFLALKDKDTPVIDKIFASITVAYALSPIDLVPDFIPVLGYLDDIILLPLFITITVKLIPPRQMENCRIKTENLWENGKPKKWYYAVPIVLIWSLIILLVVKSVLL